MFSNNDPVDRCGSFFRMTTTGNNYYYFDVRARGFVNRALLEFGGLEYTDHRISFAEWAELKPKLPLTFGQIPMWQDDEVGTLTQSDAISRYFARKFDLYGKNAKETAQIDEVYEEFNDFLKAITKATFASIDQFDAEVQTLLSSVIPKHIGFAEKLLARSGTGWFVGDSVTLADFQAFHIINNWARPYCRDLITPPVNEFLKRFREIPQMKVYLNEKVCATTTPNLPFAKSLNKPEQFQGEFDD